LLYEVLARGSDGFEGRGCGLVSYRKRLQEKYGMVMPHQESATSITIVAEKRIEGTFKTIETWDDEQLQKYIEPYDDIDIVKVREMSKVFECEFPGTGEIPFCPDFVGRGVRREGVCHCCGVVSSEKPCGNCLMAMIDIQERRGVYLDEQSTATVPSTWEMPIEAAIKTINTPTPDGSGNNVESWKRLQCEVCMHSDVHGEFWLVPNYTDGARLEITPEDFLKQDLIIKAFPGSGIAAFRSDVKPGSTRVALDDGHYEVVPL